MAEKNQESKTEAKNMKLLPLVLLSLCASAFGQIGSDIPEAPMQLVPFYLSSQQSDVKAKLSAPYAIAVARSGNIYVFDDGNSRIVKLNSQGKFVAEFGQPGSGAGQIKSAGLSDSLAIDHDENIYVLDAVNPKVQTYSSSGAFYSSFRVPFPVTGIAVNSKREVFLVPDTSRPSDLIFVFTAEGKFVRSFGKVLVGQSGKLAKQANRAVIAFDQHDNLLVAFRSWPVVRKYSSDGRLLGESEYKVPAGLIGGEEATRYSIDFFSSHPDSSFFLPLISHWISVNQRGSIYLLLNGRVIVALDRDLHVTREWTFRAPNEQKNLFVRLGTGLSLSEGYLLDVNTAAIYRVPRL